jgi:hypothetical protein
MSKRDDHKRLRELAWERAERGKVGGEVPGGGAAVVGGTGTLRGEGEVGGGCIVADAVGGGVRRGRPRLEDVLRTLEATKPWASGPVKMSRASWYRRRAKDRNKE